MKTYFLCAAMALVPPSTPGDPAPPPPPPAPASAGATPPAPADHPRIIQAGDERFDAVLTVPAPAASPAASPTAPAPGAGWGVVLMGGGLGNDLHWTTPGILLIDGTPVRFTHSGEPHADAPVIAHALASKGFTVLRWSTIALGDPLAPEWPLRATPRTIDDLTMQASAALAALRAEPGVGADRIILVGHSLGALRAVTLAHRDEGIAALVLLAPAEVIRSERTPARVLESEIVFLPDLLARRPVPVLAIFGSLDGSRAVDPHAARALAESPVGRSMLVRVIEGAGHQLGPALPPAGQPPDPDPGPPRTGPILPEVVDLIAHWSSARASGRSAETERPSAPAEP